MKKFLLLAVAAVMSLCIQAQITLSNTSTVGMLQANPAKALTVQKKVNPLKKVAKKLPEMASNERLIGLYTTDDIAESGLGLTNYPGTYTVLSYIPASMYSKITEGKITRMRYGLCYQAEVSAINIFEVSGDSFSEAYTQTLQGNGKAGWNEVTLTTPYELNQKGVEGILIGFTYKQLGTSDESGYPLSVIDGVTDLGFCLYGDLGEGGSYLYDFSSYGTLSVQAIAQCESLPKVDIVLENIMTSASSLAAGEQLGYGFQIYNYGTEAVASYQIDVKIDNQVIETVTEPAMTPSAQSHINYYTLPVNMDRGAHTLTVELVKVNGAAPTEGLDDDKLSANFTTYFQEDVVKRQKHLLEEYTSHSCTYCPYGAAVIEKMMELSEDLAVACIHGNQSSKDPFNTDECNQLISFAGIQAFPSGSFNRINFGEGEGIATGMGYNPQYQAEAAQYFLDILNESSLPAFASVDITKKLNGNKLTITVSGKGGPAASTLLNDFGLTVYLVEDGLKYRQLNLGLWNNNYIHNHVLRDVVTAINGDPINWTSASEYKNTYEVTLEDAWVQDNMSIIAFINQIQPLSNPDVNNMAVSNANVLRFTDKEVEPVEPGEDTRMDVDLKISNMSESAQIMGEAMSPDAKYVVGTNYATYGPVVWNTQTGVITDYAKYEEGAFHAVNNSGLAVGDDGDYALAIKADGTQIPLFYEVGETKHNDEFDFDYSTGDAGSSAWGVSEDGKTIIGYYFKSDYTTTPCIWNEKGERTDLPVPTLEQAGFEVNGAEVRWMTPDGSLLLGVLIDNMATWPAAIWRKNAQGGYDCEVICNKYWEEGYQMGKPYMMFTPSGLSANGEWVALNVQAEYDDWDFSVTPPTVKAARLNLKTNELEVVTMPAPLESQPMSATSIANDGSMLMYTTVDGLVGRVGYLKPAGNAEPVCLDDALVRVKGMPGFCANVPCSITSDGLKIQGFGITEETDIFSYVFDYKGYVDDVVAPRVDNMVSHANNSIYNIAGQQLRNANGRGLYIINGKKVLK